MKLLIDYSQPSLNLLIQLSYFWIMISKVDCKQWLDAKRGGRDEDEPVARFIRPRMKVFSKSLSRASRSDLVCPRIGCAF